jgi:hypothetical protein
MRNQKNSLLGGLATTVALGIAAQSPMALANTESQTEHTTIGEWDLGLTLYGWAKSVDGQTRGTDIALDFKDDIIDLLDGAFMTKIEAESGPLLIFAAYEYTKLALDNNDLTLNYDVDVPFDPPGLLPPTTITVPVDVTSKIDVSDVQHMWELGAAWRLYDGHGLDFFVEGGLRWYDYQIKVFFNSADVTVGLPGGGTIQRPLPTENRTIGAEWLQPFVGARGNYHFGENWRLEGRVTYGNNPWDSSDSNNSWMAEANVYWQVLDWGAIMLGYKYVKQDYDNGREGSDYNYSWDMDEFGPQIGFTFLW